MIAVGGAVTLVGTLVVLVPLSPTPARAAGAATHDTHDLPGLASQTPAAERVSTAGQPGAPAGAPPDALSTGPQSTATPLPFDKTKAVLARQTATTDIYSNPDGTDTAEIHQRPVNYQDAHGAWHAVDPRLVQGDPSHYTNTWGPVALSLAASTSNPQLASLSSAGWSVGFGLDGARPDVTPTVSGADAVYSGVEPGVDLHETSTGDGLKESIVLTSPPAGGVSLRFPLSVTGLTPVTAADGTINFIDAAGHPVVSVPPGLAWDSSADRTATTPVSGVVNAQLTGAAGSWAIVVSVDARYLASAVYPVTIDPSFSTHGSTTSYDAFVQSNTPGTNYNGSGQWDPNQMTYVDKVGYDILNNEYDSYQFFDMSAINNSQGDMHILSGFWNAYVNWNAPASGQTTTSFSLWEVAQAWSASGVTFNMRPNHYGVQAAGTVGCQGCSTSLNIGTFVTDWSNNPSANFGVAIDDAGHTVWGFTQFGAQEDTGNGTDPYLTITYNVIPTHPTLDPGAGATVSTSTPMLRAQSSDRDGDTIWYWFRVSTNPNGVNGQVVNSGYTTSQTWQVPPGSLTEGVPYYWVAYAYDGTDQVQSTTVSSFTINKRLAGSTAAQDTVGPVAVNLANGNVQTTVATPTLNTLGGPIGLSFTYNSQAALTNGLTGRYWGTPTTNACSTASPTVPTGADPNIVRVDPPVPSSPGQGFSFPWNGGAPDPSLQGTNFCVEWTGYITLPYTASSWNIGVQSDDGAQVWIGPNKQTLVYNAWADRGVNSNPFDQSIPFAGSGNQVVPITVDYYQHLGGSTFSLWIAGGPLNPGGEVLPISWLTPSQPALLPQGWTMSGGNTQSLAYTNATMSPPYVFLHDGDGGLHPYIQTSSGTAGANTWAPLLDGDAVLTQDNSGNYTVHDEDGTIYTFNPAGQLTAAVSPPDDATTSPASPQYSWDPNSGRLQTITDKVTNRQITFTYALATSLNQNPTCPSQSPKDNTVFAIPPDGMLCQISFWDGTQTNLYYNANGQLARIENWAASGTNTNTEVTDYAYDSSGRLSSVRDPLANDEIAPPSPIRTNDASVLTAIAYDGSSRAQQITLPRPTTSATPVAPVHSYVYDNGQQTTVHIQGLSEPNGYAHRVVFESPSAQTSNNNTGRSTDDYDPAGVNSHTNWTAFDLPASTVTFPASSGAGIETTTVYDSDATYIGHPPNRPTDTYGPAPSNCFNGQLPITNPVPSGCPAVMPHATAQYDGGIHGLAAVYWPTSQPSGTPGLHTTGLGTGNLHGSWVGAPPGLNAAGTNWSMRLTGDLIISTAASYDWASPRRADGGL